MSADRRLRVCALDELPAGGRRLITAGGIDVGVFNLGDRIVAYRNVCPHQGAPIAQGRVSGTTMPAEPGEYVYGRHGRVLSCPWHGWEFDLESGKALFGGRARLARVDVTVENGDVLVRVPNGKEG